MVSFQHGEAGTPETVWAAAHRLSQPPTEALPLDELRQLVVVAAHPDDETLGAGGLISRAGRAGLPVTVVVLTNGEASHPGSSTHDPARLAALRRLEVTDAVAALAPTALVRLAELPDGSLTACLEEASRAISAAIGADGPGTWLITPWSLDGHPDHTAAADAARHVARGRNVRHFEYPIWAWHWSTPDDPVWSNVSVRTLHLAPEDRRRKSRGMALHRSQVQPLSELPGDEPILQAGFSAHFDRGYETFLESEAAPETPAQTETKPSLTGAFFEDFYAGRHDPWGFETRWYEERKRFLTLAALPRRRFRAALELGCSIGVLTAGLADRCDSVLAVDISEQPLLVARARLAEQPSVSFTRRTLPSEWPDGSFDLIVLSEVGYYFSAAELIGVLERCRDSLADGGAIVACHWRHPVPEYPLSGDQVHTELGRLAGFERTVEHRERDFLLEVFEPAPTRSVAQREGLVP
ncbi:MULTISPECIES: bifunctional PIG-L family deacetylase/class I SAM-dependent methyltransferase [Cryobacterium]|uniref:Methyltransferase domain-containing protein n=1 Tax=Cryobacterium breve TaxID=1259258 RepID=A0ABY2ITX5_9MICO|nr:MULTISPECIES: bifunctional PIG-L family deacetylase/class I SAM-dependent methyltransferase [Cryobacterium]TFC94807.1 methyltransferase domain-containing protein [Cryobacterium breve]TFC94937.1 methyltransferase domain-containing protein [Cryobacterium sp. TmT3-12]